MNINELSKIALERSDTARKAVLLMNTFKNKGWIVKSTSGGKDQMDGIIYDSNPLSGDH